MQALRALSDVGWLGRIPWLIAHPLHGDLPEVVLHPVLAVFVLHQVLAVRGLHPACHRFVARSFLATTRRVWFCVQHKRGRKPSCATRVDPFLHASISEVGVPFLLEMSLPSGQE